MNNTIDFKRLLTLISESNAEVVVIGGLAAIAHGSARSTEDLDLCYARNEENYSKLVQLLKSIHAYPRGAPEGLPFKLDERTLKAGLNFTFNTDLGPLDILGEMDGVGAYEAAAADAACKEVFGVKIAFLSLDKLIAAKTAAGRNKDLAALDELRTLRKIREKGAGHA